MDPEDGEEIDMISFYKKMNSKLKILIAVGGWNFPSAYYSEMANSTIYRL